MKHGKKYRESAKLIDRQKLYDSAEALDLCVKTGTTKFDETVELHVKLGVDGRHADQQVRGARSEEHTSELQSQQHGQERARPGHLQGRQHRGR